MLLRVGNILSDADHNDEVTINMQLSTSYKPKLELVEEDIVEVQWRTSNENRYVGLRVGPEDVPWLKNLLEVLE